MGRWCLDAGSMLRVLKFMVIWGVDVVSFGARSVSFGMLVASNLASWWAIERSRGTLEHRKGDLGSKLEFLPILGGFRDYIL